MKNILMSALLIILMSGALIPVNHAAETGSGGFQMNNALGIQLQIAVPISISVFGSNGPQGVGQFQGEDFGQKNQY
ncbi:MAG TPA: hypothetical protein VIO58_08210 [Candidatus Methanoperedens sp.]